MFQYRLVAVADILLYVVITPYYLRCSCNRVSSPSFGEAAAHTVTEALEDAGAAVVETAAGQTDTGEAGEQDEHEDESNNEPDPPDYPALSIKHCKQMVT